MSKAIGIDLGSTMSEVAVVEGGKATVIVNEEGRALTPSVVSVINGERRVGDAAKRQQIVHPKETINLIKRFMGATYDESAEAIKHVAYDVVNRGGMPKFPLDKEYTAQEISAMILGKLKKIAEDYCGEEIKDAVITVPAYFSDTSRNATKEAGEIAGLNVLRIIAEPTAAILSSNIDMQKGGRFMVVDYGGSTLDNSIADISDGVVEIKATNGDVYLGGHDIDTAIAEYLISEFKKDNPSVTDIPADALTRIFEASEKAKIELSNVTSTDVSVPYLMAVNGSPVHLNATLTRAKFEQLIAPQIDRLIECANGALDMAKIKGNELNGILLIGGSCRIPLVQQRLAEINANLIKSSNLDTAVAEGAAIQADILMGNTSSDVLLLDVTPLSYGIDTMGDVMATLIEANSTIPCHHEQVFSTAQDQQTAVTIVVRQGNRPIASANKQVGVFTLDGIPMAPRGIPQINVSFDIDANGLLTVSAKDNGTGKEQHITIQSKSSMSKEDIEKAKADAERFADADKKAKETAEAINNGESLAFGVEKTLNEVGDKITTDEKSEVETLIADMRKACNDKDVAKIKELEKTIQDKMGTLAQKIYAQPNTDATNNTTTNEDGSETVDFEEVK